MSHYKDGSLANIGDIARTGDSKIGTIASITPGRKSCNAVLAKLRVCDGDSVYHQVNAMVLHTNDGLRFVCIEPLYVTLGECEKVE